MNVFPLLASLAFPLLALVAEGSGSTPIKMEVERLDPAIDELIPADTKVEKLAEGFLWSEGPTWFEGSVLFSDVPDNVIHRWKPNETSTTVFMKPSGLLNSPAGLSPGFREPGSNGLAVDADGRLLICQQGERRVARVEKSGVRVSGSLCAGAHGSIGDGAGDEIVRSRRTRLSIKNWGDGVNERPPCPLCVISD